MSITVGSKAGVRIGDGGIVIGPSVGVRLARGGGPTYLLRDDFVTAEAAPLTSPRTAEPGPGTLTITDTGNRLSISGGAVTKAAGVGTVTDPSISDAARTRAAGLAMFAKYTPVSGDSVEIGFAASANDRAIIGGWRCSSSDLLNIWTGTGSTGITTGLTYADGVEETLALVLRSNGYLPLRKVAGVWTLAYVESAGNMATLYPGFSNMTQAATLDTFRVCDLPAPFDTDYGLATDRLAGAVSQGATFTHEANCVIEWTQTSAPATGSVIVTIRGVDANNYWSIQTLTNGNLALVERVAGVDTTRANIAAGVAAGHRIVAVADGTTIRGYSNNVLRFTYSSASNFSTATIGEFLSGGGTISDVVAWPRQLSGTAATILDQSVA